MIRDSSALAAVGLRYCTVKLRQLVASGPRYRVVHLHLHLPRARLQVAKHAGARVFVTSGHDEKLRRAREMGADVVINHRTTDFSKEVWTITNKRGVDVVIDDVGAATWPGSIRALARGGRLITCGA